MMMMSHGQWVEGTKRPGRPQGGRLTPFEGFLIAQVEKKLDITMPELADLLLAQHGVVAAPAVLSRLLCRLPGRMR